MRTYVRALFVALIALVVSQPGPIRAQAQPGPIILDPNAPPPRPPLRLTDFYRGQSYRDASISPDGRRVAVVRGFPGRSSIEIFDLSQPTIRRGGAVDIPRYVSSITWKSDDLLVASGLDRLDRPVVWLWRMSEPRMRRAVPLGSEDDDYAPAPTYRSYDEERAAQIAEFDASTDPISQAQASLVNILPGRPDAILVRTRSDRRDRLELVAVDTGARSLLDEGPVGVSAGWIASADGRSVYRLDRQTEAGETDLWQVSLDGGADRLLRTMLFANHFDFDVFAHGPEAGQLWVRARTEGEDTSSLRIWRTSGTSIETPAASNPDRDILSVGLTDTGELVDYVVHGQVSRPRSPDPQLQARIDAIAARIDPASSMSILSGPYGPDPRNPDRLWVVSVFSPTDIGSIWLHDLRQDRWLKIGNSNAVLDGRSIGTHRWITYPSTDGRLIEALVVTPGNLPAGPAPLVVMPHGGPHGVVTSNDWDHMASFLATRGYIVAQPNFRGSGGFGLAFQRAGYRGWGGAMQDDVTALVRHLVATGVADPSRVAIVGGSYGGYSALAGAAFTPDLYRCAVSINGVSDLSLQMDFARARFRPSVVAFWEASMGKEPSELAARSPSRHAAAVRAEVLLIAGGRDRTVDPRNSRVMFEALRSANRPARLVVLPRLDHSAARVEDEMLMLGETDHFLMGCLSGQRPDSRPPSERVEAIEQVEVHDTRQRRP